MSIIFDLDDLFDDLDDFNDDLSDDLDDLNDDISDDLEEVNDEIDDDLDDIFDDNDDDSDPEITISDADTIGNNRNVNFTYEDINDTQTFELERPQAELNIFDSQYYLNSNPDVAEFVAEEYQDTSISVDLTEAQLSNVVNSRALVNYSGSVAHYVAFGASEGRNPSPLFDIQYYLEQNPDAAIALAGGGFRGDPLLHYVETGASEGRDPNPFFDSDYYLAQNSGVATTGLNPLEHYVLFGSSTGVDPSPNFDRNYYLSQNPDVASAGVEPLTHFLTFGQNEGRLPLAE